MSRTGSFALLLAFLLVGAPEAAAKGRRAASASQKKKAKARAKAKALQRAPRPKIVEVAPPGATEATAANPSAAPVATRNIVPSAAARLGRDKDDLREDPIARENPAAEEPWLEATASLHLFTRDYSYRDDLFNALPSYRLPLGSAPALSIALWPVLNLGVFARYERALGLASTAPCPAGATCTILRLPTSSDAFQVGAQGRLPWGAFTFGARAAYGWRTFTISDAAQATKPLIPSVGYKFITAGASAQYRAMPWLAFDVSGGYRHLLSTGELESSGYFPNETGAGVEGSVGVSLLLHPAALRLSFDVERHFFKLNPQVGDPLIAGGALDQFMGLRLSGSWSLY